MLNKNNLKRAALEVHKLGVKLGVQILPSHYYSPVPKIVELKRTVDVWAKPSELSGVAFDLDEQCESLRTICAPYRGEYSGNKTYREAVARGSGPATLHRGSMSSRLLHAFLIFNDRAKIVFCLSQLHYAHSEVLQEVFPEYVRQADRQGLQLDNRKPFDAIEEHFPSSIYLEIV